MSCFAISPRLRNFPPNSIFVMKRNCSLFKRHVNQIRLCCWRRNWAWGFFPTASGHKRSWKKSGAMSGFLVYLMPLHENDARSSINTFLFPTLVVIQSFNNPIQHSMFYSSAFGRMALRFFEIRVDLSNMSNIWSHLWLELEMMLYFESPLNVIYTHVHTYTKIYTNVYIFIYIYINIKPYIKIHILLDTGNRLNEYILHYEPLDYDRGHVLAQHTRNRRSSDDSEAFVHLQFHSHGKPFRLKLKRDTSTFSSNIEIVSYQNVPLEVDTSHIYDGYLLGKSVVKLIGSIRKINGLNLLFQMNPRVWRMDRLSMVSSMVKSTQKTECFTSKRLPNILITWKISPEKFTQSFTKRKTWWILMKTIALVSFFTLNYSQR